MKSVLTSSILYFISMTVLAQTTLPHLDKQGTAVQLMVKGKPFLVLGGELHNSSASSAAYLRPIWAQMKKKNLNTVIAPVYWELLEPQEGKFDFSLVDSMIVGARKQDLHLIFLWFGSWKNAESTYAPAWVKINPAKYPRAKDNSGKSLHALSAFGEATASADARAFKALMKHIRATDEKEQTVIMMQVENEVGLIMTPRDFLPAANKLYNSTIPKEVADYLLRNKDKLQPEIAQVWKANGSKTTGTWEAVFGKSIFDDKNWKALSYLTEELFTVYQYARYIGQVAAAGKEAYPIPMFVNAWLKQPDFAWPGRYPNGGPTPHTLDIWKAAAPAIDMIVPDIYTSDATWVIEDYHMRNAILIPEIRQGVRSANEALWAFGQHDILGFAPFGIDGVPGSAAYGEAFTPEHDPITKTYAVLQQMKEMILAHQGKGAMAGILVDTAKHTQSLELGGYNIQVQLGRWPFRGNFPGFGGGGLKGPGVAGGLLINIGPDEFIVVGKDYNLTFSPIKNEGSELDIEYMEEGTFSDNRWMTYRRLNGDEGTGGKDVAQLFGAGKDPSAPASVGLRFQPSLNGDYFIVRFKIYKY